MIEVGDTAVIGMGGGSDCIQASILAKILQQKGISCNSVISIRTNKTTSQYSYGNMGQDRTINNAGRVVDDDIYLITPETRQKVLDIYTNWDMNGENEKRFGKTPLAWQQALKGETGVTCLNIPTKYVLDKRNPWIPFVNIQPMTQGMFFMDTQKCLDAIRQQEKSIFPEVPEER